MAPFLFYGQIKAKSSTKNLYVTNINTKAIAPNRQIGLPLNSSFFSIIKTNTICATPFILAMFSCPFLRLLKIINGSL